MEAFFELESFFLSGIHDISTLSRYKFVSSVQRDLRALWAIFFTRRNPTASAYEKEQGSTTTTTATTLLA